MTTQQISDKSKTVTRRFGWWFLKPGDVVQPVEKAMGLKKGEQVKKIGGLIRILSTRKEPLFTVTQDDCVKEGFPDLEPYQFVEMLCRHYKCRPLKMVNRIEFEYI